MGFSARVAGLVAALFMLTCVKETLIKHPKSGDASAYLLYPPRIKLCLDLETSSVNLSAPCELIRTQS